jgi:hypothetical protein
MTLDEEDYDAFIEAIQSLTAIEDRYRILSIIEKDGCTITKTKKETKVDITKLSARTIEKITSILADWPPE